MFGGVKVQEIQVLSSAIKCSSMSLNSQNFFFLPPPHPQLCTAYFIPNFNLYLLSLSLSLSYLYLIKCSSMSLNSQNFSFLPPPPPQLCTAYFISNFTLQEIFPCYAMRQMIPHNSDKEKIKTHKHKTQIQKENIPSYQRIGHRFVSSSEKNCSYFNTQNNMT